MIFLACGPTPNPYNESERPITRGRQTRQTTHWTGWRPRPCLQQSPWIAQQVQAEMRYKWEYAWLRRRKTCMFEFRSIDSRESLALSLAVSASTSTCTSFIDSLFSACIFMWCAYTHWFREYINYLLSLWFTIATHILAERTRCFLVGSALDAEQVRARSGEGSLAWFDSSPTPITK